MPVATVPDPLKQPMIVQAPGIIRDVIVGGGGRFLLLPIKDAKQMAVFDVNSAAVVKTVRLPSDTAMVAAGAEKFIVVDLQHKVAKGIIVGKVEAGANPVVGGKVWLVDAGGKKLAIAPETTDADGRFKFEVEPGTYQLYAEDADGERITKELGGVKVDEDKTTKEQSLSVTKK